MANNIESQEFTFFCAVIAEVVRRIADIAIFSKRIVNKYCGGSRRFVCGDDEYAQELSRITHPFFALTSCLFMGSTRSGSYCKRVKSPNIQAAPKEIRPKGSWLPRESYKLKEICPATRNQTRDHLISAPSCSQMLYHLSCRRC